MYKKMNSKIKWLFAVSLVFTLVLSAVGTVSAAEFPKGETIPASETIDDDVFISGNNVTVEGTVNGILFASGQTVTLTGTVNGDAFLFGETIIVSDSAIIDGNLILGGAEITMNGSVTGSVFGGSAAMVLANGADIGRNFYYGGFSLTTEDGTVVGKDLLSGTYQSILSGTVERDLKVGAGAIELNGKVGRNAVLEVGVEADQEGSMAWTQYNPYMSKYVPVVIESGIRVSEDAQINGKLTYTSSVDQTKKLEAITSGTVIYQTPVPYETEGNLVIHSDNEVRDFRRNFPNFVWRTSAMNAARNLIKLMVLGAVALWLLRKPFKKVVDAAYAEPLKAMGWGFIVIAVGSLAAFILPLVFIMVGIIIGFASLGSLLYVWFGIIGLAYALASALFLFAVFTLSKIVAAYMFGKWIMKAVFKETEEKVWLDLLVGVFLYVIIRAIPIVGWIAALAATLIGTGAFWLAVSAKKE
ncbi:MAG: hypothetical protein Q7J07_08155 [Pelolinea sp.]|nr:hypothetical protein [Pelolinea sp.]